MIKNFIQNREAFVTTGKHLFMMLILFTTLILIPLLTKFFPDSVPEILTWEPMGYMLMVFAGLVLVSLWLGIKKTIGVIILLILVMFLYYALHVVQ